MALAGSPGSGLLRSSLGAGIAGLATGVLSAYTWWSARGGVPTPDVSAVILLVIAIGVTAGLVSGRFRAAPASWALAVMGSQLAYQATGAGTAAQHSSFTGHEVLNVAFLFVFVAGGHLLGVWAGEAKWRGRLGAAIAGFGTCVLCLYAWWSSQEGAGAGSPAVAVWVGVGTWIIVGVVAGLISGRFRDALASWAVGVIGFMLAYLAFYGIELGVAAPVELLLYGPVTLLLFVTSGHLLGVGAATLTRSWRSAYSRD